MYLWRPEFEAALDAISCDLSCYHIDDEYSFAEMDVPLDKEEVRLLGSVGQVFIHSPGLLERKGSINPQTSFVPNGVDYEAYSTSVSEPLDLRTIARPRIGYSGFIKRTLDWELLLGIAGKHREWNFVFVGARTDETPEMKKAILEMSRQRNVHFLGPKTSQELAAYPQHFDVCIMPYKLKSHSAKYGYPLKLHEYLASGRPTIGSAIRSLEDFQEVVALPRCLEEWEISIKQALSLEANTLDQRKARQSVAKRHDWNLLIFQIARTMAERLGAEYRDQLEVKMKTASKAFDVEF